MKTSPPAWRWVTAWVLPLLYGLTYTVFAGSIRNNSTLQVLFVQSQSIIYTLLFLPQLVWMLFLMRGPAEGRAPGPAEGRAPGPAEGRAPGPAEGRAPGPAESRAPGPAESRAPARTAGRVLGFICLGAVYFIVISSSNSAITRELFPVTTIENSLNLFVIPYIGAIVVQHLPNRSILRAMQFFSWRGLVLFISSSFYLLGSVIEISFVESATFTLLAMGILFFLTVGLSLKPARQWWQENRQLASLLAVGGTGILMVLLMVSILRPFPNLEGALRFTGFLVLMTGVLLIASALAMLTAAGLRFAFANFPTPSRLRQAGLLDWRGALFLGCLVTNLILVIINTFSASALSLDAAVPLFAIYMLIVLVLYWHPAGSWQRQPQVVYPFASVAILTVILLLIFFVGAVTVSLETEPTYINFLLVFILYLIFTASAFTVVSCLPWLQSLWNERLPSAQQDLKAWKVLVGLVVVDYAIVYLAEKGSLFYSLMASALVLAGAFLLAPRLPRLRNPVPKSPRRWHRLTDGLAVIVAFLSLTGILTANEWVDFVSRTSTPAFWGWNSNLAAIANWAFINIIVFILPLLGVFSLGLLLNRPSDDRRSLARLVLAVSILVSAQLYIIYPDRNLEESGLVSGIAWLAIFSAGWLVSDLLPKRVERWEVTFTSGFLLLCLSPLLLPLIDDRTDLTSYLVSLPIWSSRHKIDSLLWVLLAVVGGTLLFALMLRSGQAMLRGSRTPRPEIVTLGMLLLGAFLTLTSSYNPTTVDFAGHLEGEGWESVVIGADQRDRPTYLYSDAQRIIWLGGQDRGRAWVRRFNGQELSEPQLLSTGSARGVLQIEPDSAGLVWVLTDQEIAAFKQDSGQVLNEFNRNVMANELGTNTGEVLDFFTFYFEDETTLWLGTSLGMLRLDVDRTNDKPVLQNPRLVPPRNDVGKIGRDSQGHWWAYLQDNKLLLSEVLAEDQMAQRFHAKSGVLEFDLDLTQVPASVPISLEMTVHFSNGVAAIAQVRTSDGQDHCLSGRLASAVISSDESFASQDLAFSKTDPCLVVGKVINPAYAVQISYQLDAYAGKRVAFQFSPLNERSYQGEWFLLGAWLQMSQSSPVQVLFEPGDCQEKELECVHPDLPQDMVMVSFNAPPFVWAGSQGPLYAQSQFDLNNDTNSVGSLIYRHTGLTGLKPLPLQKPVTVSGWTLNAFNEAIALAPGGLYRLDPGSGSFTADQPFDTMAVYDISAVMVRSGNMWVAGIERLVASSSQNQQYAIKRYDAAINGWQHLPGVPIGNVKQLGLDSNFNVWALIQDKTYRPNSIWWFIIPVIGFIAVGLSEYIRQPATLAGRIRRRLHKEPGQALPILYEVLRTDRTPGLILSLLPAPGLSPSDQGWLKLAQALEQVAPDRPLPTESQLLAIAEAFEAVETASDPNHAPPDTPPVDAVPPPIEGVAALAMLYRNLSMAMQASSIFQVSAWPLRILHSQDSLQPLFTSETQQPQQVPGWIDTYTVSTLDTLSEVAAKIRNYLQVDSSQDKLIYLADAVTAAGEALRHAEDSRLPEQPILRIIATDWIEMVRSELNNFSGRARLRLELRTRQIRRAAQATVALRLTNTGRAVAETPVVELLPGEGYSLAGTDRVAFEHISSNDSVLVEFSIHPSQAEEARIVCQVSWADRIREDNSFQFADKVRFYRQSGEFQRIPNPYIAGNPLKTPDLFRGREDVFQFIAESLSGPVQDRTLVLHGQRRTGKTSVLYQLLNGRLGPRFIPVFIDMQEIAPLINTAADLFSEMAYAITRALHKSNLEIESPGMGDFETSAVRTFRRFIDQVEDLIGDQRVVLLFDEFELLESKIEQGKLDTDLLGYFRSLIQHRRGLLFIFTGTHRLEEMSHNYWSVLFNLALHKRISYLDLEDAQQLVREPVRDSLTYDELAVEKILALTRCHPYFTQLICFNLVNQCNKQERNYATLNDVNDAVDEILVNGEANFAYIWQSASPQEQAALAGLAHALGPGQDWAAPREILETLRGGGYHLISQQDLLDALDGLVVQEVLEYSNDGMLRYRYQIELIQKWIATNKQVVNLVGHNK